MSAPAAAATGACLAATVPAGLRWLRVAQREHYLAGSTVRFALRWWSVRGANGALALTGVAAAGASWALAPLAFLTAGVGVIGPLGLSLHGRTAPLAWTRRLRTLAALWAVLQGGAVAAAWVAGSGTAVVVAAIGVMAAPAAVDVACFVTAPIERMLAGRHVTLARAKLATVAPTVVAITGSYGKTSTKGYIAHLVGSTRSVVASPASFNNRAGLARTINDHLEPGTEVLVAEMGTYGKGEIAELCSWCPPRIAVITAIGPVHLERFGTEEMIAEAKAEVLEHAEVAVLNVDDARLAALADRQHHVRRVVRCSSREDGFDVSATFRGDTLALVVGGEKVAEVTGLEAPPTNVACAVAAALELGVDPGTVARLLPALPVASSRLSVASTPSGLTIIDDTYNSNPAGCAVALAALERHSATGARRAVVTPGMVELGSRQAAENSAFAAKARRVADDFVIVGRTNRGALLEGALRDGGTGRGEVVTVGTREEAVEWVRSHLGQGDAVLYENDLPDHFA